MSRCFRESRFTKENGVSVLCFQLKAYLRSFHPNRTCTLVLVKVCPFVIQYNHVNPRNEIKRGVPTILIETGGAKVHPSGAIFLLTKAMQCNCTTILGNTKLNVQKSGNI